MVKKIATNILVLLLAGIFLMSFTGVRMLMHHCLSCDTTDVALFGFAGSDCDALHHKHAENTACSIPVHGEDVGACCASGHSHNHNEACGNCCKTEIHYLKNDYQVSQERNEHKIEPVVLAVLIPIQLSLDTFNTTRDLTLGQLSNADPPNPVGRDFVIFSHQLKIA